MPETMRYEHSGDEGISGFVPAGRVHDPAAQKMLAEKQEALQDSIRQLEDSIAYIDWKQNFYDDVLSGRKPYVSNLIP